jgi:hypothetical protein
MTERELEIERIATELCAAALAGQHRADVLEFDQDDFGWFVAGIVCEPSRNLLHEGELRMARIVDGWRSRCEAWAQHEAIKQVDQL